MFDIYKRYGKAMVIAPIIGAACGGIVGFCDIPEIIKIPLAIIGFALLGYFVFEFPKRREKYFAQVEEKEKTLQNTLQKWQEATENVYKIRLQMAKHKTPPAELESKLSMALIEESEAYSAFHEAQLEIQKEIQI